MILSVCSVILILRPRGRMILLSGYSLLSKVSLASVRGTATSEQKGERG